MPNTTPPAPPDLPSPDDKIVDPTPHESGHTSPSTTDGPAPRLPHERDESSDSQVSPPDPAIEQAHRDVERGLVDTDRGPVTDELYERAVRPAGGATRDRGDPAPAPQRKAPR